MIDGNRLFLDLWFIFRVGFILFALIYLIFSLIIIRQVNLMTETVLTETGFLLRALVLIHAFVALGVLILFILNL